MEIISAWELYLWTRLDNVAGMLTGFLVVGGLSLYCYVCFGGICAKWATTHTRKFYGWLIVICTIMMILVVARTAIPSKKDMAMIYVLPQIVNNQQLQDGAKEMAGEVKEIYDIAKSALKEYAGVKEDE